MEHTITHEIEEQGELAEVSVVNRSVLIAFLNEEFYTWYKTTTETPEDEKRVLEHPHTFLIPPVDTDGEVEDYLAENFFVIFESLLEEFIDDEETLVEALTEDNFDNWVDYNFSTFVMDAATDYELGYEEDEIEASTEEKFAEEPSQNFASL
ncbi:MAG: hypothetical protein ACRBBP_04200 [Bdellovibrionales bacterium]